jgi:hypothetical protein
MDVVIPCDLNESEAGSFVLRKLNRFFRESPRDETLKTGVIKPVATEISECHPLVTSDFAVPERDFKQ